MSSPAHQNGCRLVEIVLAPAHLRAQLRMPLDPATDAQWNVETPMAVVEHGR
ncbi:hypothetical protein [Microbacterium soli]|uniref:hypothetical protein n=1 Tax=Microbacterium soli TaxID=446075 RepID=UPI0031CF513E